MNENQLKDKQINAGEPLSKNEPALRVSQMKLLALLAAFIVPLVLAAGWLYYVRASGGELGVSARGQLIRPAVYLQPFELSERGAEEFDQESLRGIWTLVYAPAGECADVCQKNIYHMRQVRLSLVQRLTRLQRALILESEDQVERELLAQHPGLRVLSGDRDAVISQIRAAEGGMPESPDALYLIDPLGNLMMRFPADLNPKSMLKDIKHLLKVSRIG